jgi:hypothetical protein
MPSDLDVRKREISALVDEINDRERTLSLPPEAEGFEDFDRMEAMDIINRIERRILANVKQDGDSAEPPKNPEQGEDAA